MTWAPGFDPQPMLSGERLLLRPTRESDWAALFSVASDKEIWALHPAHDRWQEDVFLNFFDVAMAGGGNLTVIDRANDEVIGSSRYGHDRAGPGEVEIGYTFLARTHWGGAYNREMKQLMVGHALTIHDTCIFFVGAENARSRRAMEKIGGVLRADPVELGYANGSTSTHVIYEIREPLA